MQRLSCQRPSPGAACLVRQPRAGPRRTPGTPLPGAAQQMLAFGRALAGAPKALRLDEPMEGLAPIVVERLFPEPVTQEFFANALRKKGWCLDLYRAEYVEGYLGADGLRAVCVFRAPDAESVRLANNEAGVPYTKVWTASAHISG